MVRLGNRRARGADLFWALRNVSFEIQPGRMVGIIGPNGAGKSTLLRLIGGIGQPDEGSLVVNGRVAGLLELGAGFHPDLTGRENVFVTGVVGGLTRAEVAKRFDSIVAFAELERFIDSPLRTYSSGMYMRLAFSVAVHVQPDVLLVDEVLAVGDLEFQGKCLERIAEFKRNGSTIVLVTHDANTVRDLCDEAVWLDEGEVAEYGEAREVASHYIVHAETRRRTPRHLPPARTLTGVELKFDENRLGSQEISLTVRRFADEQGRTVPEIRRGGTLLIEMDYTAGAHVAEPIFNISICDMTGHACFETTAQAQGHEGTGPRSGSVAVSIDGLDLEPGPYFVDVGVYEKDWNYAYDYHWHAYPLRVTGSDTGVPDARDFDTRALWSSDCGELVHDR